MNLLMLFLAMALSLCFAEAAQAREAGGAPQVEILDLKPPPPVRGWWDCLPKKYPDLAPHYHKVPDALNAVPLLLKARGIAGKEYREWHSALARFQNGKTGWDQKFWAEILRKNNDAMKLTDEALKKPRLQIEVPISPDTVVSGVLAARFASDLKQVQFQQALEQGRLDDALNALRQSFHLSSQCFQCEAGMIGWLIAAACYEDSLLMANRLMQNPARQPKHLQNIDELLLETPPFVERFQEASRMEFDSWNRLCTDLHLNSKKFFSMFGITQPENGKLDLKWVLENIGARVLFQPNKTIRMHAASTRYVIRLAEIPRRDRPGMEKPKAVEFLDEEMASKSYWSPNAFGRLLYGLAAPATIYPLDKTDQIDLHIKAVKTLLALMKYREKHGEFPESLRQLVPCELESVPADPYDGSPLRYSKAKKRLWSAGTDGKDEGGRDDIRPYCRLSRMKEEPTFPILFPKNLNRRDTDDP